MKAKDKSVIFDFDGVIYDSEQINYEANQIAFNDTDMTFTPEEYKELWIVEGLDLPEIVRRYGLEADLEEIRRIKNLRCKELFLQSAAVISDEVKDTVASLIGRKWKTAIGSSNTEDNITTLLDRSDMRHMFDAIVGLESIPNVKPEPNVFLECLRQTRTRAKNAVVVEDAPKGITAARKAKIETIIAIPNAWTEDCDFSEANIVLESIEDLPDAIN
ncbi:hypothetical protein COU76_04035 [Candidatus Peregrinibacteria bacterium CG10_big_fil_rev_8_21_14_0_10_49_10]|nr:MAG: hypothetical protein COU76_04035 [Candidatus Peregrinibacteria bacterium CG10_big_fil_rev_8_21_14_0_10_49_10]